MARNYVQEGCVADWTNGTGAAVASGGVVAFGMLQLAVALVDIAAGAVGSVQREGVFNLAKAAVAITQGQPLWWDATAKQVLAAPAKNAYFLGFAFRAAAGSDATVDVALEEFDAEGPRVLTLAATGNETLNAGDLMGKHLTLLVPNSAAKTLNLPSVAAVPPGAKLQVRKTTAAAFAVTIDPAGAELIDGAATSAIVDAQNEQATWITDGSAWTLISNSTG